MCPIDPQESEALPARRDGEAEETGEALTKRTSREGLSHVERGELWLGHFQQLTTLTVTGGAGLLILLQMGVMERTSLPFYVSLISCGIALILSLGGQAKVLDESGTSPETLASLREIRRSVFLALAVAAVSFVVLILS